MLMLAAAHTFVPEIPTILCGNDPTEPDRSQFYWRDSNEVAARPAQCMNV